MVKHAIGETGRDLGAHALGRPSIFSVATTIWSFGDKSGFPNPPATEAEMKEMMKLGYLMLLHVTGRPVLHGGEICPHEIWHDNSYNAADTSRGRWVLKKKNYDLFT